MNLRGKRLMILGGNRETGALVEVANGLGIHTIVVDPNPDAPAKRFAVESHELDGFDVGGIVSLAARRHVDGVLVGVADILVAPYYQVCERLGLPCYASEPVVEAFCTKDGFRDACRRFGVRDIPSYLVGRSVSTQDLGKLSFPVMVKPVDSGAGVGMRVCASQAELVECINTAIAHSKSGRFMVERYMSCEDIFAYYTFKDGKAFLSAIADRITTKKQGKLSPVCIAALYPSRHVRSFLENGHPGLLRMFEGLGVRDGVLNVQFFVEGNQFFAYDPGFRLQGEAPHIAIRAVNGFDHRQMLLNFALTGTMGVDDLESRNDFLLRGKRACTLWVLLKSGIIRDIRGLDSIRRDPCVVFVLQRFEEGDRVATDMVGTERQVLARIYMVADSGDILAQKVEQFKSDLSVVDSEDNDMIVDWLDPALLVR
jgi:biotin carboxylase